MARNRASIQGCLLGMAVGDAMGYTVDSRNWQEIREDYGPNGLLGYDLVNGYADISSHTQLAAFTVNGLLLALTRGQMNGKMAPLVKYVGLSSREWAASQRPWSRPDRLFCWLSHQSELCRRHCMDTRMLETLLRDPSGTMEDPKNNYATPGSLSCAIGVGLFAAAGIIGQEELDRLGAEVIAMTHGSPLAFLSGAALAHIISRSLTAPETPLRDVVTETIQVMKDTYGHHYSQCFELCNLMTLAVNRADSSTADAVDVMEQLQCDNAAQVLAGAVFACLHVADDFDGALIAAVNHSGRSAAVGAIVGAILGMRMGSAALPEFYVECLEPAEVLTELADDLFQGCPMELGSRLFDLDWDRKYIHGGN